MQAPDYIKRLPLHLQIFQSQQLCGVEIFAKFEGVLIGLRVDSGGCPTRDSACS